MEKQLQIMDSIPTDNKKPTLADVAKKTGLKAWKVREVLCNLSSSNLQRVSDDEMAIILHAAADLGYQNLGRGGLIASKFKEVTLADLAKRAGVSIATASYALQETGHAVGAETKGHVKRIAQELGYKPTRKSKLKDFYNKRK